MKSDESVANLEAWLLDSDPALRWQVERDLLDAPPEVWEQTRRTVASKGFGAQLLAKQDDDGQWAGGAYFPGDFDWHNPDPADVGGQPWIATTWSLNTLREWGVDAAVLEGTAAKLAANSTWEYDDLPYWAGEVDCCINAFTLANGAWLGVDTSPLLDWFAEHRMSDGGWDCEWENGSTRSSYHSTLNTLLGLVAYEEFTGISTKGIRSAGEQCLLARDLYLRRSTGEPVAEWVFQFSYPFRWRYNVLRAADYFRRAASVDRAVPDARIGPAIAEIRSQRQDDGTWLQGPTFRGRTWFDVDVDEGAPSKWLTFYATRVLRWWDSP